MKKYFLILFILPVCIICFGHFRNVSVFSLDNTPLIKIDSSILGTWHVQEDNDELASIIIGRFNLYQYKITYKTGKGKINELNQNQAFFSIFDSVKFINLSYNKDNIRGYLFFKFTDYDSVSKKFTLIPVKDTTLETYNNRQDVRDLFSANLNNDAFYSSKLHFIKIDSAFH